MSETQRARPSLSTARRRWHRDHRFGIAGIIGATVVTVFTGFLGPSAVTLTLGPRESYLPPWYLPAGVIPIPNEWLVSGLIWFAVLLGALSLWVAMRALADGWKPGPLDCSGSAPVSAWPPSRFHR